MSKIALNPDLMRDLRAMARRLDALEAQSSGPRFFGPYTTGNVTVSTGQQTTATWTHNLNWPTPTTKLGVLEWIVLASGSLVPRHAISAMGANTITFAIDMTGLTGSVTFAIVGYVLIVL